MKIPKTVKICGLTYKVSMHKKLHIGEGLAGKHTGHTLQIDLQNDDYAQEKIEQTFFHEVLHAIDDQYLNRKLSEDQTTVLANSFYAFLKDNNFLK